MLIDSYKVNMNKFKHKFMYKIYDQSMGASTEKKRNTHDDCKNKVSGM
jgi:hypothetical protein